MEFSYKKGNLYETARNKQQATSLEQFQKGRIEFVETNIEKCLIDL